MEPESDRIGAAPHEVKDAEARPIVMYGVALTIGAVVTFVIVFGIFHYFTSRPTIGATVNPMADSAQTAPVSPHIEEHPASELAELRARENQVLGSYGWVDRKAGAVRVPIDRAMQTVLERGLPTRKEAPGK